MTDFDHMCPKYQFAVELLCKRWTWRILRSLVDGPRRFTDIAAYVDGLSDRLLAQRLQELESEAIVERRLRPARQVVIEYALTQKGQDLRQTIEAIQTWADRWCDAPDHIGTSATAAHPRSN